MKTLFNYASKQIVLFLDSCHCLQLLEVFLVKLLLVLLKFRTHQLNIVEILSRWFLVNLPSPLC